MDAEREAQTAAAVDPDPGDQRLAPAEANVVAEADFGDELELDRKHALTTQILAAERERRVAALIARALDYWQRRGEAGISQPNFPDWVWERAAAERERRQADGG